MGRSGGARQVAPQITGVNSPGTLINEAMQNALQAQRPLVEGQYGLFPGLKSATDLYTQRLAEPIPLDILNDIAGRFRAEQSIRSPGSAGSPTSALQQAVEVQRLIEEERQRAAGAIQGLTEPFTLRPISSESALQTGMAQEGRRIDTQMQNAQDAARVSNANRASREQRVRGQQAMVGGLAGAGLALAAPFAFPALGKALGQGAGGFSNPANFANLMQFGGLGASIGSRVGGGY